MNTTDILSLIDAEIATLQQARALIAAADSATTKKRPGRPAKDTAAVTAKPTKKRKLTPEGRARIAEAVKRRWAAQRKNA
jgi:hypothetical protein